MKWHKFQKHIKAYPWLKSRMCGWLDLGEAQNLPLDNNQRLAKEERLLKKLVREEIEFIAPRPFDSLDLALVPTSRHEHLSGHGDWRYDSTLFSVMYHFENELPFSRGCMVGLHGKESVRDSIYNLRESEGREAYAKGLAFIVDGIIREDVSVNEYSGKGVIAIQIYECGVGSGFNLTPPLRVSQPDPCLIAYLRGDILPPLMPSPVAGQI